MFFKSKLAKKLAATFAVAGLLSFGASAVSADVVFEQTLDLTDISGGSFSDVVITPESVCMNLTGLGSLRSTDFTSLVLKSYVAETMEVDVQIPTKNLVSANDGTAALCIYDGPGSDVAQIEDFTAYDKITVAGKGTPTDINLNQTLNLSAIQGAAYSGVSGDANQICANLVGLGSNRQIVFETVRLRGYTDQTISNEGYLARVRVNTDGSGAASLCFGNQAGEDFEGFQDFTSYTRMVLEGTAKLPITPTVNATFDYADGVATTGTASAEISLENICVNISGLTAWSELAVTDAVIVSDKGTETEITLGVQDQSNFSAWQSGDAQVCYYGGDGSEISPLGDLTALESLEVTLNIAVGVPLERGTPEITQDLDTQLFPELTIENGTPYIDPHLICFEFTGAVPDEAISMKDIVITLTDGQNDIDSGVSSTDYIAVDENGNFSYCLSSTVADPDGLGNLSTYDSISFSAVMTIAAQLSDVFGRYLDTKGLTYENPFFSYDADKDRTTVTVDVTNPTDERLAFNVLGMQWEGQDMADFDSFWLIESGETSYITLGWVAGDQTSGDSSIDIWFLLQTAVPSALDVTGVKLPAGLEIVGDAFNWYYSSKTSSPYWADKTMLSLKLLNTTSETLTLKVPLVWKVGNTPVKTSGFQVVSVEPDGIVYVAGGLTDIRASGDIRQNATVKVTGTITTVAANTVDESDIVLPEGVSIERWNFEFAPAEKRTAVYVTLVNPCDPEAEDFSQFQDLVATAVYFGTSTKSTGVSPVASVGGATECWSENVVRQVIIGYLPGDQRFGKTLKVRAEFDWAVTNPYPDSQEVAATSFSDYVSCFVTSPSEWLFEPSTTGGKTTVMAFCYNVSLFTAKVNLSGLTGSYQNESEVNVPFGKLTGVNKLKLASGEYKTFKVLSTPGDVRNGGLASQFGGTITITK